MLDAAIVMTKEKTWLYVKRFAHSWENLVLGAKEVSKHLLSTIRFYSSLDTFENEFHIDDVAPQRFMYDCDWFLIRQISFNEIQRRS